MCHAEANNMLRLEKLPAGQSTWTEEQTRKNFDTVSKIVQAVDDPLTAKILTHPLAPEAGGDAFHSGGRQFASKNDPNWKIIAQWAPLDYDFYKAKVQPIFLLKPGTSEALASANATAATKTRMDIGIPPPDDYVPTLVAKRFFAI